MLHAQRHLYGADDEGRTLSVADLRRGDYVMPIGSAESRRLAGPFEPLVGGLPGELFAWTTRGDMVVTRHDADVTHVTLGFFLPGRLVQP